MNKVCSTTLSIFFLLTVFHGIQAFSGTPARIVKTYNTGDGLPNNHVRIIKKDRCGLLWIACWDGLASFDGSSFNEYFHDPGDSTTIPYIEITYLEVDKNNNIWILARTLCRYNREKNNFIRYHPGSPGSVSSDTIYSIATDKNGNFFVLGNRGLEQYIPESGKFDQITITGKAGKKVIFTNDFLIQSENYIWILDGKRQMVYKIKVNSPGKNKRNAGVISDSIRIPKIQAPYPNFLIKFRMTEDKKGNAWMTTNNGLLVNRAGTHDFTRIHDPVFSAVDFNIDQVLTWSEEKNGLFIYDPAGRRSYHFESRNTKMVEAFSYEGKGHTWLGGVDEYQQGTGLNEIMPVINRFNYYPGEKLPDHSKLSVYGLLVDSYHALWFGSKSKNFLFHILPSGKMLKEKFPSGDWKKTGKHPGSIVEDNDHNLWIGFYGAWLFKYDRQKDKFTNYYPGLIKPRNSPDQFSFTHLIVLPGNRIFSAGGSGLMIFDTRSGNVLRECIIPANEGIYSVCRDETGNTWVGGSGDLLLFDKDLHLVRTFPVAGRIYNIEYICPGSTGKLWLALLGGGLCNFDIQSGKCTCFSNRHGLVNNTVYSILKAPNGKLWISTDKGISMFNPSTEQFVNYGENDGLDIGEFNSDASFGPVNGELFFGGMGGVVSFNPDSLLENNPTDNLQIVITSIFHMKGKKRILIPVYGAESLRMDPGTRYLAILFSVTGMNLPTGVNFRYRFRGFDDDWETMDRNTRRMSVSNLPYGKYEFQLEATNIKGEWIRKATLPIIIPPYFYERPVFIGVIFAISLMLVLTVLFLYLRNYRLRERNKIQLMKLISLQGQLNPHYIANTLWLVNTLILEDNKKIASTYINEVSRLMRNMVRYTGQQFIPFFLELEIIESYIKAEQIRTEFAFQYEIGNCGFNFLEYSIAPFMIQVFVENAIKNLFSHTGMKNGFIRVSFEMNSENHVVCIIEDNGVENLMKEQDLKKYDGQLTGEEIIRERLALYNVMYKTKLNLRITDPSPGENGKGTMVRIDIPVKYHGK